MKRWLTVLLIWSLVGCGSANKSPTFLDNDTLTVSGRYLTTSGAPLTSAAVQLQNLRLFGYIDQTQAAVDALKFFIFLPLWLSPWPFFPIYRFFSFADMEKPADYYFDKITTASDGTFQFSLRAGDLLRDESSGINIVLTNAKEQNGELGRYTFVIKDKTTALGDLQLCDLGGLKVQEDASALTLSWSAPSTAVQKYVVSLATADDQALLWAEDVAKDVTSLKLSKTVLGKQKIYAGVEAFYADTDEKKISCLTPLQEISLATSVTSVAQGSYATSPNIKFKMTSLTNETFHDSMYLAAFDAREITLDLNSPKSFSTVVLHNLKLKTAGNLVMTTSTDGTTFTAGTQISEKRFIQHSLSGSVTARYVRFTFSSALHDLQEISLY